MDYEVAFYKIIDELCQEKKIEQKMLSFDWIRQLKKDGKIKNLIKYQFDLNSANSCRIANDKYATYELLSKNDIPIIDHKMIFNPKMREDYFYKEQIEEAINLLNKCKKVVIKANESSRGKDVILCEDVEETKEVINRLFSENHDSLSICPFVDIEYEYRAIYLNGKVIYIYKKQKPFVIGDGIKSVTDLILDKFGKNNTLDFIKEIDYNKVLDYNEKEIVSWKHNLCNGAEPILIDESDEYYKIIENIAIKSAKIIDINFATVDIALTNSKEVKVVEINSSVCMDKFANIVPNGYKIAKNIYSEAIDIMFNR